MNTKTGGPAFPFVEPPTAGYSIAKGMTLRDYFAAKAMQGLYSDADWRKDMHFLDTAYAAYKMADAMLKAREA
jgi:hypothetical protein